MPRPARSKRPSYIWGKSWRRARGIHDSFFELAGTRSSASRLGPSPAGGAALTPHQIFDTGHRLGWRPWCRRRGSRHEQRADERSRSAGAGPAPSFFRAARRPESFQQALLLKDTGTVSPDLLARSAATARPPRRSPAALPLRRCEWRQTAAGPGGDVPFSVVDLSALLPLGAGAAQERAAAAGQVSLRLATGPLVRALFFRRDGESDRLLARYPPSGGRWCFVAHPPGGSGVRLPQLARSGTVVLPPKTTSFRKWGESLERHARFPEVSSGGGLLGHGAQASAACLRSISRERQPRGFQRFFPSASIRMRPALPQRCRKPYQTAGQRRVTCPSAGLEAGDGEPTERIRLEPTRLAAPGEIERQAGGGRLRHRDPVAHLRLNLRGARVPLERLSHFLNESSWVQHNRARSRQLRQPDSRSSRRMRHETPSTTRWWIASSNRSDSPSRRKKRARTKVLSPVAGIPGRRRQRAPGPRRAPRGESREVDTENGTSPPGPARSAAIRHRRNGSAAESVVVDEQWGGRPARQQVRRDRFP